MGAGISDLLMVLMVVSTGMMGKAAADLATEFSATAEMSSLEESAFLGLLLFLGNRIRRSV